MLLIVNFFTFLILADCFSSSVSQEPDDTLNQCGVPWDDINGIAEAAIIQKCLDDFADGYPSFCGFRVYFELLWEYVTGGGQLNDELTDLANELWNSVMYPGPSTESTIRKAFQIVFGHEIPTSEAKINDFNH